MDRVGLGPGGQILGRSISVLVGHPKFSWQLSNTYPFEFWGYLRQT
jgi:hypothetical protein